MHKGRSVNISWYEYVSIMESTAAPCHHIITWHIKIGSESTAGPPPHLLCALARSRMSSIHKIQPHTPSYVQHKKILPSQQCYVFQRVLLTLSFSDGAPPAAVFAAVPLINEPSLPSPAAVEAAAAAAAVAAVAALSA